MRGSNSGCGRCKKWCHATANNDEGTEKRRSATGAHHALLFLLLLILHKCELRGCSSDRPPIDRLPRRSEIESYAELWLGFRHRAKQGTKPGSASARPSEVENKVKARERFPTVAAAGQRNVPTTTSTRCSYNGFAATAARRLRARNGGTDGGRRGWDERKWAYRLRSLNLAATWLPQHASAQMRKYATNHLD